MKILSLRIILICILSIAQSYAQDKPSVFTNNIEGFRYGNENSPSGKEWESPQDLSLNKEAPHAYFFSFENVLQARKVLPENSKYWLSLDGKWKFNWVKHPNERPTNFYENSFNTSNWDDVPVPMSWNILGIQKDGSLKYGVPIYVNQQVIFQHTVKVDDWKGGVMREPSKDWTTYIYRNEVGSYKRLFDVPKDWSGREIFINFDGVDNFFYLWINGTYVGFSKNSRNLASFNITPYINKGLTNTISIEVYRNSDASFLEAQDMFRLPGIFRTVSLTSKPKVHIRDLIAIPDLTTNHDIGTLSISSDIRNLDEKQIKNYKVVYSLYENKLYSDDNEFVNSSKTESSPVTVRTQSNGIVKTDLILSNPKLWSAEKPYRYTLIAELKNAKNKTIETISTHVGFRKVEIKDTKATDDEFGLAGRYFYINGKTVKLKGVNRHETNPNTGKVISHEQMESEIKLMKQANINHVRNAHYPDHPYWYYLCDKYGIYLEDEANIESHQYYYGEASTSHPKEWKNAHIARNLEMVHATINRPSVVIWSLGNEAGPGQNFVEAYKAIKTVDVSRPVQYERNNSIVDMGSNQYPSIGWVRGAVKGTYNLKYPLHISEYAHSMGNAAGNLIDYWEAIESTNFFMGGALWDWIDQSMYYYDKETGEKFLAYGGDFGDKPNDGTFVNNGLIFADVSPKPQYYEVKKVYQNIGVKATDISTGEIEIFNKNYFTDLTDYDVVWSLYEDGVEMQKGRYISVEQLQPRTRQLVKLPIAFKKLKDQSEYFVKVQFLLNRDTYWAKRGYVQMEEQIFVKEAIKKPTLASVQRKGNLTIVDNKMFCTISGDGFKVDFDLTTGSIHNLSYGENQIIKPGKGPKLDAFRAPVDNDNWAYKQWVQKGLHNLKHKTLGHNIYKRADGACIFSFLVESKAPNTADILGGTSGTYTIIEHKDRDQDFKFTTNQIWTVYTDGSIELESIVTSNDESFVLARLGYSMEVTAEFENYTYYGRGPINNYADRKTAQNIERHKSTVNDQFVPWPNPQSMSNNEEVRWASLTNKSGNGAIFIAKKHMSTSVLPWSELDVTLTSHPHRLPKSTGTHLHLDAAVTGLGGNSCGQGPPLEQDRVKSNTTTFGFVIRPIVNSDFTSKANISASGEKPLGVTRSQSGQVSITSEEENAIIHYQIDKEQPQIYTKPFNLRHGGQVAAWYANKKELRSTIQFTKVETIPMQVVFSSSQETGEEAKNLVDGNSNTIWHTMYSLTVAQYPHWVDFDAGDVKNLTGFSYLPRQDGGSNGNIKRYKIQVSIDGKDWGDRIIEGEFERSSKVQIVRFKNIEKARYIRFTALSSQNGQDFASGAEFTVLAE